MDAALRENVEGQLQRLLSQLSDLEELKDDLTPEEYEKEKKVRRRPGRAPSSC